MKITPFHILLLTLFASVGALLIPSTRHALNEMFGCSLISCVYFWETKAELSKISIASIFLLAMLVVCNFWAGASQIHYFDYVKMYFGLFLFFGVILAYIKWMK
jgi:hypothetical protein